MLERGQSDCHERQVAGCEFLLLEQIGVCSGSYKDNQPMFAAVIKFVGKQKVTANMTLPMPDPIATQRVIEPFWPNWPIVRDQQ